MNWLTSLVTIVNVLSAVLHAFSAQKTSNAAAVVQNAADKI